MSDQQRFAKIEKRIHEIEHLLNAPSDQNITGAGPSNTATQKHNATDRQVSFIADIPPTPTNPNQAKEPWYKTGNGWKTALEIVAIPFAIGYAIVTFSQWQDLRRNFALDERSWMELKPKGDGKPLSEFESAYIPADIINIGKTPARKVEILSNAEVIDRQLAPTFNYTNGSQATTYVGLLPPNMPLDVRVGSYMALTETQRRDLESGKCYIVGYAIVTWEDIFGKPHWMHFCARHTFTGGSSNAKTCSDYNDADAN